MNVYQSFLFVVTAAALLAGCAAVVPQQLTDAREAYRRASTGPAAQRTPAEVHKAAVALRDAEESFIREPKSYQTRDLAYIAQRKSEEAEALADIAKDGDVISAANTEYETTQAQVVKSTKQQLDQSRVALAQAELGNQRSADRLTAEKQRAAQAQAMTAEQLASEKTAREAADVRAADATAALAKLAAVKEEERGQVITLSGSVLFASDKSELLPSAQTRLGQVADALLATRQRTLIVEGHTDSRGSESHNIDLSLRRAEAVRDFLIQKGYDRDRISAQGIGRARPVADNNSAEGRANNRRVEIVKK